MDSARPSPTLLLPQDLVRGALLTALGALLLVKVADGAMLYYVKADLIWLMAVGGGGLLLLGLAHLARWFVVRSVPIRLAAMRVDLVLLVPLAAGLLLPARPLGAAALDTRGLASFGAYGATDARLAALQSDTTSWTLLDWSLALEKRADSAGVNGSPVDVVGFAYDRGLAAQADEFGLARFVVTCCTADGSAVGLPVRWEGVRPRRDEWVRVRGSLAIEAAPSGTRPIIVASQVEPVSAPTTPYLYP